MPFRRLPPLPALRAFEAVARRGSFKAAAEELHVTAGALSQQVRKLEDEMGVTLFVRRNRQIDPTPAGYLLKAGLTDAFTRMREAVESVRRADESATLVVSTSPSFAAKWLVPRLGRFVNDHPGLDVRLAAHFTALEFDPSEIDVAIEFGAEDLGKLHRELLTEETLLPLASPAFVRAQCLCEPGDMLRMPLLTEDSMGFRADAPDWPTWFRAAGLPAMGSARGINFGRHAEQAIDAAVAGAGVALCRRTLASLDIERGRLVAPFGPQLHTRIRYEFVCRPERLRTDKVALFRDWLLAEFVSAARV